MRIEGGTACCVTVGAGTETESGDGMETNMEDEMEEEATSTTPQRELSAEYLEARDKSLVVFEGWTEGDQVDFIENLLLRVCHYQHGQINEFLTPMLQRDFITLLPSKSTVHHMTFCSLAYY